MNEITSVRHNARNILKKQSSIGIVLNGGDLELDDATVPFQIAFNQEIAKGKPTHILVIDVTKNVFEKDDQTKEDIRKYYNDNSERKFFNLEPINYFQFKSPGIHNLIFILLSIPSKKDFREEEKSYLSKETRNSYFHSISYESIEENNLESYQCGYCEVIVDVPKQFFAEKPQSGFKSILWRYVNSWYSTPPIDQCDFRKRSIGAYTIKPILLLIAFAFRILFSFFALLITSGARIIAFIFGFQPVRFIPKKKEFWWEFLFLYKTEIDEVWESNFWWGEILSRGNYGAANDQDYYEYKDIMVGKKLFHSPFAVYEIVFYFFAFKFYYNSLVKIIDTNLSILASFGYLIVLFAITLAIIIMSVNIVLPTIKNTTQWKNKWKSVKEIPRRVTKWMLIIGVSVPMIIFIIFKIPWMIIINSFGKVSSESSPIGPLILGILATLALFKYIAKPIEKLTIKLSQEEKESWSPSESAVKEFLKEEKKEKWLRESFDLKTLPEKVDLHNMPKPSTAIHIFRIKFWQTKAKVCKPYAK